METRKFGVFALLFCCLIWGTTFVFVKISTTLIDPFLLSTLRNVFPVVILSVYFLISKKKYFKEVKKEFKYGIVLGFILASIYVVQTFGLKYTTSSHSAFITSSAVIMVPVFLWILFKEKIGLIEWFSIFIVGVGLYFLTTPASQVKYNIGDLITLIGAVICAFHIIYAGLYVRKVAFLPLIFFQFLFSMIFSFIGFIIHYLINQPELIWKNEAWFSVSYLGVLGTFFCFFVMIWAQKFVDTVTTALIFSFEPIFAASFGYFMLNDKFQMKELFGALVIFIGLLIYANPLKKKSNIQSQ